LIIAAHQQLTHEWWDKRRNDFEMCISELVLEEAGAGDPQAAQERLEVLREMTLLDITAAMSGLANELVRAGALPANAADDALHIAVAATNGIPFLLTWNCRHLANATMRPVFEAVCANNGLRAPIICTAQELLEAKR
jgi:hypothetical protein